MKWTRMHSNDSACMLQQCGVTPRVTVLAFSRVLLLAVMCCGLALARPSGAQAQGAKQKVIRLNKDAMDRYTQLDVDAAYALLQKALSAAKSGSVRGEPLARTYLNMATIQIAGFQSNAKGLQLCVKALEADPSIELDPLTSTPEVQTIYDLARTRVDGAKGGSGGAAQSPPPGPQQFDGPGNIPHTPAPEQVAWTAVPLTIEVPEDAVVGAINVYYRGAKMDRFVSGEMVRIPGGYYGFEIPCEAAAPGTMRYYIIAHSQEGEEIGFTGNESQPVTVPIVSTRTYPPSSLPGHEPPQQCRPPKDACDPDDEACLSAALSCESDSECEDGYACEEGQCRSADAGDDGEVPRFIAHIGFGFGGGFATSGMPADRGPDNDAIFSDPNGPYIQGGASSGCGEGDTCVRVTDPGFVPIYALRLDFGYFPWERVGFSVFMRYQLKNGNKKGFLPPGLMLGLRVNVRATKPSATGFDVVPYLGISYGELQIQPNQAPGQEKPFIISGLNGFQIGSHVSYRFIKNFGLYAQPEFLFQFPTFLFAMELSAGVEVAF